MENHVIKEKRIPKKEAWAAFRQTRIIDEPLMMKVLASPVAIKAILGPVLKDAFSLSYEGMEVLGLHQRSEALGTKDVVFDALVRFKDGTLVDLDMQLRRDKAKSKRLRVYEAHLTLRARQSGGPYEQTPRTAVVFFYEKDPYSFGDAVYVTRRVTVSASGTREFGDESYIIQVNCSYDGPDRELADLLHDIICPDVDEMHNTILKDIVKRIKYPKKEEPEMTDFIQRYFKKDFDEYRRLYQAEIVRQLKAKDDEYAEVLKAKDKEVNEANAAYALLLDNLRSSYRNGRIDLETAAMLLALPVAEAKDLLKGGGSNR